MPTPEQVRTAIDNHFRFWNAGDRSAWIANFAENVIFHDPVSSPPKHGRSAAERSWDNSFSSNQTWTLVRTQLVVCGDEAAITLDNHGVVNGQAFTMRGIEIWQVDDSGRVCQVRAYFEPPPALELEPYFQRQRDTAGEGAR